MIYYIRKITVKKSCKYGKYGSFEHLLLLLFNLFRVSLATKLSMHSVVEPDFPPFGNVKFCIVIYFCPSALPSIASRSYDNPLIL